MSEDPTPTEPSTSTRGPLLGVSTALAYVVGIALILFLIYLAGPIELAARLRILDDLSDMGLVQVTDPGSGLIIAGLQIYEFARTPIRRNAALAALVLVLGALLVRGFRYRLIANHAGIDGAVTELGSSYFFGLGMNLLFPFGPGEYGMARTLTRNGADPDAAVTTVYYTRLFEVLALSTGVFVGLVGLGWSGGIIPIVITVAIIAVLTAMIRPFGRGTEDPSSERRGGIRGLFDWMNVTDVVRDLRRYFRQDPSHAIGLFVISVFAIYLEVTGFWFLKKAFSTPIYVLLGDITFVQFGLVVAAASFTRVVPFTPAALGIYEGLMVALLHFGFGEGYVAPIVVAFIDALLLGFLTALLLIYAVYRLDVNVMDTWRSFLGLSRERVTGRAPREPDAVVGGDAD